MPLTESQIKKGKKYRAKTIKKEVVINPETHPKEADFIENKRFDGSFNAFVIKLIGNHIDQINDKNN